MNKPENIEYFYGAVYQEKKDGEIQTLPHKRSLALFSQGESISEVRNNLHLAASMVKGDLTYSDEIGKNL